ncbi:transglycosylase SLT domain-containing protein [Paracraurococcus lichenis]|uniref:Transglycosylase SLT domain-containing protein n=1 Tax=Paracraurococcus lichenis TaxID=3064888 RepID=A0ABT9E592_9PROT|nr:transglycosylase SLT domain-containing protein [Paracraurococcus sp. LOR1-02]MDO9711328.1 transglycosylase SLT domain-containing protein [Paracraurococcus sp. LOR1-02]
MRPAAIVALVLAVLAPAARAERPAAPPADPSQLCRQAIQAAERTERLPAGLLHAIGRVEAGRPDAAGRGVSAWPWTINAEGQGRFFDTREQAIAAVEALRVRGVKLIDVGCMQVNLHHHAQAFPDLRTAFDPQANATYAAQFLNRLHAQSRSWEQAAANYHSQTPELAEAYRIKVMEAWPAMAVKLAEERRREAMVAAWSNGRVVEARPIMGNGFQVVAMAGRPGQATPPSGPNAPLLVMGTPVLRRGVTPAAPPVTAARTAAGRRPLMLEVAEAQPGRVAAR